MMHLLSDTHFWILLAFIILIGAIGSRLWHAFMEVLDTHRSSIQHKIDNALRLREEAQSLLHECQMHHKAAHEEALKIVNYARHHAELIREKLLNDTKEFLQRREEIVLAEIETLERTTLQEITHSILELSVKTTENFLAHALTEKSQEAILDEHLTTLKATTSINRF